MISIPNCCKSCSKTNGVKFEDYSKATCNHSKCAILFSGGIDSAVIAALADKCLPAKDSIDLLNVAFEMKNQKDIDKRFLVPDRITGLQCLKELNQNRKWNFVQINIRLDTINTRLNCKCLHTRYYNNTAFIKLG